MIVIFLLSGLNAPVLPPSLPACLHLPRHNQHSLSRFSHTDTPLEVGQVPESRKSTFQHKGSAFRASRDDSKRLLSSNVNMLWP